EPELSYEPRAALEGGADGLAIIETLLHRLRESLEPGGTALLECHYDQAVRISGLASAILPGCRASIRTDLAGIERFVRVDVR
ncbi:MAG: peptide chain release factor N(5)-glutamine methyltransferase, partial [Chloroflexota bacterium]